MGVWLQDLHSLLWKLRWWLWVLLWDGIRYGGRWERKRNNLQTRRWHSSLSSHLVSYSLQFKRSFLLDFQCWLALVQLISRFYSHQVDFLFFERPACGLVSFFFRLTDLRFTQLTTTKWIIPAVFFAKNVCPVFLIPWLCTHKYFF